MFNYITMKLSQLITYIDTVMFFVSMYSDIVCLYMQMRH